LYKSRSIFQLAEILNGIELSFHLRKRFYLPITSPSQAGFESPSWKHLQNFFLVSNPPLENVWEQLVVGEPQITLYPRGAKNVLNVRPVQLCYLFCMYVCVCLYLSINSMSNIVITHQICLWVIGRTCIPQQCIVVLIVSLYYSSFTFVSFVVFFCS
jgi:hypothetical protein